MPMHLNKGWETSQMDRSDGVMFRKNFDHKELSAPARGQLKLINWFLRLFLKSEQPRSRDKLKTLTLINHIQCTF